MHIFLLVSYSVVMSKFIALAICFIFPGTIKAIV